MKLWSVAGARAGKRIAHVVLLGLALCLSAYAMPSWAEEILELDAPAPAKPKKARIAAGKAKGAAKAAAKGPVTSPECTRTGHRVIAALARDDSGAALQFHTFYAAFKCPAQHLAHAFGCLVNLQTAVPNLSNPSPQQVAACWEDPATPPKAPPPPAEPPKAEEPKEEKQ